ncbi:MAG: UDP-N-acetylmuramate dehydrogenase [Actinomycetota bacterium]|nr:UDP-N-acetylmuramate dehydrogenase [Actinomycetota bacterium]
MTIAGQQQALDALCDFAVADEPLAPHTTYKVGGSAAIFASPRTDDELRRVAEVVRDTGLPVLVVGRGSNLLVADDGFPGIAVSLAAMAEWIRVDDLIVEAGAAVALPVLARRTVAAGLAGFEWAVGVPGSIGGAVRMNAGGHGSDMAAVLIGAHVLDLRTGHSGWVPVEGLGLHFRGSALADHQVVLDARLQLSVGDIATGESALTEIVRWRREHQPGGQNAGSVFVNPIPGELPAAVLIDQLHLRGFRVGGAFVSEKHANFIQATEGATAADVRAVMEHVRATVLRHTGVSLRSEVRLIGFTDVPAAEIAGVTW